MLPLILVLGAAMGASRPAHAQGTDQIVPNPMSTSDIMGYARWLDLSSQQKRALLNLHDAYRAEYRQLREGPIERFMQRMNELQQNTGMPNRDQFKGVVNEMQALRRRIRSVDRNLFDQMQGILSEEQLEILPRVRLARERASLESLITASGAAPSGSAADISRDLRAMAFDPQLWAQIDPHLAQYEQQLTTAYRDLADSMFRMWFGLFDALEAAGLDESVYENAMTDPQAMEQIQAVMQQAWMENVTDMQRRAKDLRQLNLRTVNTVGRFMKPQRANRLRRDLVVMQYPSLYVLNDRYAPDTWLDAVDSMEGLSDQDCEQVRGIVDAYLASLDPLLTRAVELGEQQYAQESRFAFQVESDEQLQSKVQALREETHAVSQTAQDQLVVLLGVQGAQSVQTAARRHRDGIGMTPPEAPPAGAVAEEDSPADHGGVLASTPDRFIPARMSITPLMTLARDMQVDDTQRAILTALYDEYRTTYRAFITADVQAIRAANARLWDFDAETGLATIPTEAQINHVYDLRREAHAKSQALDANLWAECGTLFSGDAARDALRRLEVRRQIACSSIHQHYPYRLPTPSGDPAEVDLAALVETAMVDDAARTSLRNVVPTYEARRLELVKQRFEVYVELNRLSELLSMRMRRANQEATRDDEPFDYWTRRNEVLGAQEAQLRELSRQLVALDASTLEACREQTSDDQFRILQRAYRRKAYAEVYTDPYALDDSIERVLQFGDLTPAQRSKINELSMQYAADYEAICRRMIDAPAPNPPWLSSVEWSREDMAAYNQASQHMEKLRFERDELNARINTELSILLSDSQLQALGGLPDLPARDASNR
jgi:hypothetical protein